MNILFVGDSWTYGDELQDNIKSRFSRLVCDELNATEYNISDNGISNDEISERTTMFLNENKNIDFAVIQFSFVKRISLANSNKKMFKRKLKTLTRMAFDPFDRSVFRYYVAESSLNHKAWYDLTKYRVILLHSYLKSLNIKHLFVFLQNDDFLHNFMNDITIDPLLKVNCVKEGLIDFCIRKRLKIGEHHHALEEGHEYIAKQIIIPNIKRMRD